ncbi:DNA polymerase III subunit gamma/tau [Bacillus solimangrovi]|uniref:DNA-directed DNA polymerase n=1 Tax=Bacillus solimangrovi TaxID=1305675 RepID=A0A1E5LCY2_9BACI|nr:DNA polymerase III subunit gamma/tau [Bacillus solimangrovi]OEH91934.1 DNA polymerase III subunit gamma/tau [Bacillus solimangrovi]
MAYQALYRVWRPQAFRDVVGQEHISKTLQNALVQEKFSHAYLFSGPRGTGKTSAAKILAKAVNCEQAPVAEPCNECPSCLGITNGSISDVIEIDAASNNGVDEIRDIRDKVKYAPSAVRYKVYIIDEVHMLSIGAFNALLKTLEEPPKHVLFVLATTEPHKIPPTIVSRCQRFDFRRVPLDAMVKRMRIIADEQKINVADDALALIAKSAEGGMRDALSLFDQSISFSGEVVSTDDVLAITGAVSQQFLNRLAKSLIEKDVAAGLSTIDELNKQGKEPIRFLEDLIIYFRDMLLVKTAPQLEEVLERVAVDEVFQHLAENVSITWIYEVIEQLNQAQQEMKYTSHPKVFLEIAIVKLCQRYSTTAVEEEGQLGELQQTIHQLQTELRVMKEQGVNSQVEQDSPPSRSSKAKKPSNRGFQAPVKQIREMLKSASKKKAQWLAGHWGAMKEQLKKKDIGAQAMLLDSEPVAASDHAFVLAFKHGFHCEMASTSKKGIIEQVIEETVGKPLMMLAVTYSEWEKIKAEFVNDQKNSGDALVEEDPVISEAKKLFGEEILEIKE